MTTAGDFARMILEAIKRSAGDEVAKWSEQDRALVGKVARAAFTNTARELATGKVDAQARLDLAAQVQNVAAAVSITTARALTTALQDAVTRGASMIGTLIPGLIKAITK